MKGPRMPEGQKASNNAGWEHSAEARQRLPWRLMPQSRSRGLRVSSSRSAKTADPMEAADWLFLVSLAKCLSRTKGKRQTTKIRNKSGTSLLTLRKEKDCQRTRRTITPQPIREPRSNGKIPGNMQTAKKDSEGIGNLNRPITMEWLCQNQPPAPRENPGPAGVTGGRHPHLKKS